MRYAIQKSPVNLPGDKIEPQHLRIPTPEPSNYLFINNVDQSNSINRINDVSSLMVIRARYTPLDQPYLEAPNSYT